MLPQSSELDSHHAMCRGTVEKKINKHQNAASKVLQEIITSLSVIKYFSEAYKAGS
jgi:hypothetical protein